MDYLVSRQSPKYYYCYYYHRLQSSIRLSMRSNTFEGCNGYAKRSLRSPAKSSFPRFSPKRCNTCKSHVPGPTGHCLHLRILSWMWVPLT